MRAFFLSDLHLREGNSPQCRAFTAFLREQPRPGDILLLGGDIFDLFVGNKAVFREKFRDVLSAIAALASAGVEVHYLEGNHDFHMAGAFGAAPVKVETDDFSVSAGSRSIYVSHGDMIDPEDKGYRLLRAVTRHPVIRRLVACLPGAWIAAIGNRSSQESRKYNNTDRIDGESQRRLRSLYLGFARARVAAGAHHVLVGHSHLRDQISIGEGEYVNLGFSRAGVLYAVLETGATRFEIKELSLPSPIAQ